MADKEVVGEVLLRDVRLSFAQDLYTRGDEMTNDDGTTRPGNFHCNFLIDKEDDPNNNVKKLKKAADEAKRKKWGDNPKKWPKLKPEKVCLRDGDLEDWDGYEGHSYVSASNSKKPSVIQNRKVKNKDGDMVWAEAEEGGERAPYSGCYVNALVRLWVQDNKHGKRINASLEIVQYLRKGEAFGAGPVDPNEKFSDDLVGEDAELDDDEDEDEDDDGDSLV
jgi:hypothetical protein